MIKHCYTYIEHWHVYSPRGPFLIYVYILVMGMNPFEYSDQERPRVGGGGQFGSKTSTAGRSATIYLKGD